MSDGVVRPEGLIVPTEWESFVNRFVVEWGRSLDPWHPDAFPDHLKHQIKKSGKIRNGWVGYDWAGNQMVFIPDPKPEVATCNS